MPIFSAPVLAFLGKKIGRRVGWVAYGILTYTCILLMVAGFNLWNTANPIYEEYSWTTAVFDVKFGFLADGLSLPVAFTMNLVCTALVVYSTKYLDHRIHVIYGRDSKSLNALYYSLFSFFAPGLIGISFATNLIQVYIFLDLLLVPLYFLISYFGYIHRQRIATMGFLWGFVGGSLFLIGSIITYSQTRSFLVSDISSLIGKPWAIYASLFMLLGILVKLAVFGFHIWLPWVEAEPPTCIAGVLAVVVGIENYLLARIFFQGLYPIFKLFSVPLMIWAVVTMIYGGLLTLAQDDIKRLYACSTICQTAYSLLGLASCTAYGAAGGIFYFLSHSLGKAVLFSVAGIIVYETGIRDMREMGGLARKMPLTATLCILGSMILSAIPPLSGFQAEWIMFVGIFRQGSPGTALNLIIAVIGIFATFLATVYTFWPIMRVFFGPLPKSLENVEEVPLSMTAPLFILAVVSLLMGLYPDLIMKFVSSVM